MTLAEANLSISIRERLSNGLLITFIPQAQRLLNRRRLELMQAWRDSSSLPLLESILGNPREWEEYFHKVYTAGATAIQNRKAVDNTLSVWQRQNIAQRVTGITRGEKSIVRKIVTDALSKGQSIDAIEKILGESMLWKDYRARRVARTEINAAMNAATFYDAASIDLSGYRTVKNWLGTNDDRIREAHSEAHTTQIGIDIKQPFLVGGEKMMFPGDATLGASAANLINCRCTLTVSVKR